MIRRGLILLSMVGLLFVSLVPTQAQQITSKYFYETGHTVTDEFLTYYLSAPDPLLVYGLPITQAFIDSLLNKKVQYFQRARFEYDPNAPAGQRVHLTDLGTYIFQAGKVHAVPLDTHTPTCRQYRQYFVCDAFLAFFEAHGGLEQFGYPISNYSTEGDQFFQYFERARFEYLPGQSRDTWVRLGDIGRIQFDQSNHDPRLLPPIGPGDFVPEKYLPTSLQIRAYVAKAVVKANSQQGLTVIVLDQFFKRVEKAHVIANIKLPGGNFESFPLPDTDEHGVSRLDGINVGNLNANQIILVEVIVSLDSSLGNLRAAATTWFQVWW